jgi:hypothetical protein
MNAYRAFTTILCSVALLCACAPENGVPQVLPVTGSDSKSVELPLEVIGAEGYTVTVQLDVHRGSSAKRLWMRINNLSYDDKASVQINGGAWINLRNDTAQIEAAGKAYGGIGGGYSSLQLSIPVGGAVDGANTVRFRFNQSDGFSIGYRVLALNLLDEAGQRLVPAASFKQTDPNAWTPLRGANQDIARGQTLWNEAALKSSYTPNAQPIRAHCSDCHAQDGRDLYGFNYSNRSIVERSKFHGLTQTEGEQIASYIRNLKTQLPTPGPHCRPWNPPYQPGPGLDAVPLHDWTCGAGLEAVLQSDADSLKYVFPNGVTKDAISTGGLLNAREIPVAFQLPDWKRWLPRVHPKDAWGDYFVGSNLNKRYAGEGGGSDRIVLRDLLKTRGEEYALGKNGDFWNDLYYWGVEWGERWQPPIPADLTRKEDQLARYSTAQWLAVKNWELAQEFNLERLCPEVYRARVASQPAANAKKVETRSWCGQWRFLFDVSPHILQIPETNNIFGGESARTYFANAWYYLQLLTNPGSGNHVVHLPTDWQYAYGLMNDLKKVSGRQEPLRNLIYIVKGTQEMANGIGVDDVDHGWNFRDASPLDIWGEGKDKLWQSVPDNVRQSVVNAYLETWLTQSERYPEAQWQRIDGAGGDGWCGWSQRRLCWRDYQPGTKRGKDPTVENFATWSFNAIPKMRDDGIDGALLNRYADLMDRLYPNAGFTALKR